MTIFFLSIAGATGVFFAGYIYGRMVHDLEVGRLRKRADRAERAADLARATAKRGLEQLRDDLNT